MDSRGDVFRFADIGIPLFFLPKNKAKFAIQYSVSFYPNFFVFVILMLYICDIKYDLDMETMALDRKQTAFRLRKDLIERLKMEARKENRSLNNYVESVLMDVVYRTPNDETLASMKEAKEGRNLEKLNLDTFEDFVKSLE